MTPWVRAGLVAALFSGAPSTVLGLFRGEDLLASTEAVGSVVLPSNASRPARIVAGGIVHFGISLLWARVIAAVLGGRPRTSRQSRDLILVGAVCGLGIGVLDLGVVGRRLPPIRALPTAPQLADHLAYGALVGWILQTPDRGCSAACFGGRR